MSKYILVLTAIMMLLTAQVPLAASASEVEGYAPDFYLLLVIEASNPSKRGWAEPVVLIHSRPEKLIVIDSLDCNTVYTVNGTKMKMGEIYQAGGEKLVMSAIKSNFGISITKFAKTTYDGLGAVAKILGKPIDTSLMIAASKSNNRNETRREQLKFIDTMAFGMHNLTVSKMFSLFSAAFKYVDTNISMWEMFNLGRDLIGGTLMPKDGPELSFQL